MPEKRECPQCKAELPADSPEGLCPACLLQAGASPSQAPTADVGEPDAAPAASSGPHFVPPTLEALGAVFPQLELLELLGCGGMGAVYRARQKHLDRFVALKILPPELGQDPAFAERFAREARALARLNHPSLISVYDYGQAGGYFFILMEYVDGANLREVQRTGKLSPAQALAIVPQLCEALQYAHDEGVVHRDIKPENILFDRKGRVKLADFGLAKLITKTATEQALTGSHQVVGTWQYMAPEQIEHAKEVDHRADIYSLGVVLYEMLTGELPLGRFEPPSRKIQLDVRLDEVVLKTLEKDPARRYQQAEDVKTDVERIAQKPDTGPAPAAAPSPVPAPAPPGKPPAAPGVRIDSEGIRVTNKDQTVSIGWNGVNVTRRTGEDEVDVPRARHGVVFYGVGLIVQGAALVVWVLALFGCRMEWASVPYHAAMLLAGPAIVWGAVQLLMLRSLAWSYTAAILALTAIPFWYEQTFWLVWLPIAIFDLAVLNLLGRGRTQEAFLAVRKQEAQAPRRTLWIALGGVVIVLFLLWVAVVLTAMSGFASYVGVRSTPPALVSTPETPSVGERVQQLSVDVARLKGHFGTVQPPPDVAKALTEAEQCASELYNLQTGAAVSGAESEAPGPEASSPAQRARDRLHRLQTALGMLESRGAQSVPAGAEAVWKVNLSQLQQGALALWNRAEEIGAMEPKDFGELQSRLSDEFNTLKRVELVLDAARTHRFTTKQVDGLLEDFENTGASQARVLECLLPRLTDAENAARLWGRIPLQGERERIRTAWEGRGERAKAELAFQRVMAQGQAALAEQRFAEAAVAFQAALKLKPADAAAQAALAQSQAAARDQEYRRALTVGRDALVRGDAASASSAFRQALAVKPDATEARDGLARAEELLVRKNAPKAP